METHNLLAPCDAGRRLGITTSGVIKLARRGVLHAERDSRGRRFFTEDEIDREVRERANRKRSAVREKKL
jgi:predicted site-specific integrase-resolvase